MANIGDTRAVLSVNGKAERLSKDHKAIDPEEINRVRSVGGSISGDRLSGILAITRAFGDTDFKNEGLSA